MKAGPLLWLPLPWALGKVSSWHKPFKSCFRCHNHVGPGHKLHWSSKLDVLETPFSGAGSKSWGSNVGFKHFSPQGEAHALVVPFWLWLTTLGLGFMVRLYPSSYLLWCGPLSFTLYVGSDCFSFFFRGICSIFCWIFNVFVGRGEPKIHLRHHLDPEPQDTPS